jgi:hypothetical protein
LFSPIPKEGAVVDVAKYGKPWVDGKFDLEIQGNALVFKFRPVNEELPELVDYDVSYRRNAEGQGVTPPRAS